MVEKYIDLGLSDTMKSDRAAENEDYTRLGTLETTLADAGNAELSRYTNPTLTGFQEAELQGYSDTMNKKTTDLSQMAGLSGSQNELDSMKQWSQNVAMMRFDMKETIKKSSWAKGMESLGLSQEVAQYIADMHQNDEEEKIAIYSGLMSACGSLISKRSGK